jgi:hypothetical protein
LRDGSGAAEGSSPSPLTVPSQEGGSFQFGPASTTWPHCSGEAKIQAGSLDRGVGTSTAGDGCAFSPSESWVDIPPADHSLFARRRSLRIVLRAHLVVGGGIPVLDPLAHISVHVVQPPVVREFSSHTRGLTATLLGCWRRGDRGAERRWWVVGSP